MPVILNLGTIGQNKAQTRENIDYLILDYVERVACAKSCGVFGAGQVGFLGLGLLCIKNLLEGVYLVLCQVLELIEFLTHLTLLLGGNSAEIGHEVIDGTFLAQVLKTQ